MKSLPMKSESSGFTLLEVMLAMAIIAIALTAALGSQTQGVSLASEAKFITTAAFLAQSKMAELEAKDLRDLISDTGDFGEDFPDYRWDMTASDPMLVEDEQLSGYLKQIDLTVSWGGQGLYEYRLRLYRFVPQGLQ